MRLLDTTSHKLTDFQSRIPPYVILSHVWGEEEVTFHAIADLDGAKKMQGFAKIAGACNTAAKDGFQYIWIDTCCINKDSSAELSEAINSMYNWYRDASVCYAYLADVSNEGNREYPSALFAMSRWFSRGWTLQELIAPSKVVFYEASWIDIGTKSSMQETISTMTGISAEVIVGSIALDDIPVAVRMSWAAGRSTTREEDIAYSLMGLFGINMPLLYGEGRKAFIRLQHEIIKTSNDHSIFAWELPPDENGGFATMRKDDLYRGILARSPKEFYASSKVERITIQSRRNILPYSTPYSLTNRGLHIELPTLEDEYSTLAFLDCYLSGTAEPLMIRLKRLKKDPSMYARVLMWPGSLAEGWKNKLYKIPYQRYSLYLVDDYNSGDFFSSGRHFKDGNITLNIEVPDTYGKPLIETINCTSKSNTQWSYRRGSLGVLIFEEHIRCETFAVVFGYRQQGVVWCDLLLGKNPEDEDAWRQLEYCRSDIARKWLQPRQFRDRASGDLANGWSVIISSRTIGPYEACVDIEIARAQIPRVLPKCPNQQIACVVIPPAPIYGFKACPDEFQQHPIMANWFESFGVFILYMDNLDAIGSLIFKRGDRDEDGGFTLFVQGSKKRQHEGKFVFTLNSSKDMEVVPDASKESVCSIWNQEGRETRVSATMKPLIYKDVGDCVISISVLQ